MHILLSFVKLKKKSPRNPLSSSSQFLSSKDCKTILFDNFTHIYLVFYIYNPLIFFVLCIEGTFGCRIKKMILYERDMIFLRLHKFCQLCEKTSLQISRTMRFIVTSPYPGLSNNLMSTHVCVRCSY